MILNQFVERKNRNKRKLKMYAYTECAWWKLNAIYITTMPCIFRCFPHSCYVLVERDMRMSILYIYIEIEKEIEFCTLCFVFYHFARGMKMYSVASVVRTHVFDSVCPYLMMVCVVSKYIRNVHRTMAFLTFPPKRFFWLQDSNSFSLNFSSSFTKFNFWSNQIFTKSY